MTLLLAGALTLSTSSAFAYLYDWDHKSAITLTDPTGDVNVPDGVTAVGKDIISLRVAKGTKDATTGLTDYFFRLDGVGRIAERTTFQVYVSNVNSQYDFLYGMAGQYQGKDELGNDAFTRKFFTNSKNELATFRFLPTLNGDSGFTLEWKLSANDLNNKFYFKGFSTDIQDTRDETSIAATPIPAAAWLLGSGIIGLVGIKRKTRRNAAA